MVEIQKTSDKLAAQQARMAKARAARAANRAQAAVPPMEAPRKPGRPPKSLAATLAEAHDPPKVARSGTRVELQPGEVLGRNGEILSRSHVNRTHDEFDVPEHMKPDGWEYQWNPVTVTGNSDVVRTMQMKMHSAGWRPVPAERHAGVLIEAGAKGVIIRGQSLLEERPKVLSEQARAEDLRNARQLISDRNESLKLTKVGKEMADGFEMRSNQSGIRMQIDKSLDVVNLPRPQHELEK